MPSIFFDGTSHAGRVPFNPPAVNLRSSRFTRSQSSRWAPLPCVSSRRLFPLSPLGMATLPGTAGSSSVRRRPSRLQIRWSIGLLFEPHHYQAHFRAHRCTNRRFSIASDSTTNGESREDDSTGACFGAVRRTDRRSGSAPDLRVQALPAVEHRLAESVLLRFTECFHPLSSSWYFVHL